MQAYTSADINDRLMFKFIHGMDLGLICEFGASERQRKEWGSDILKNLVSKKPLKNCFR